MRIKLLIGIVATFFVISCGSKKTVVEKPKETTKREDAVITPKVEEKSDGTPGKKPRSNDAAADYIEQCKEIAIEEMQLYGIPASITLAQGILESGSGNGDLARRSNNHFGIKCHSGWTGQRVYHDDDERGECFRKYPHPKISYRDHSLFLFERKRYFSLFKLPKDDYKAWAKGLRKAGYATDPKYPEKLISLIDRYKLYELDAMV